MKKVKISRYILVSSITLCKSMVILLILTSCTASQSDQDSNVVQEEYVPNEEAIALNDSAVSLLSGTMMFQDSLNNIIYENALILLDDAIEIDGKYDLAYSNKIDILKKLERYQEAIRTLDEAIIVIEDYAEGISEQGFIYERIGRLDSANMKYDEALMSYKNRIENDPNNINDKINMAFILIFTHGKGEAIDEIDKIISDTDDQDAKQFRNLIENFDRDQFIRSH